LLKADEYFFVLFLGIAMTSGRIPMNSHPIAMTIYRFAITSSRIPMNSHPIAMTNHLVTMT